MTLVYFANLMKLLAVCIFEILSQFGVKLDPHWGFFWICLVVKEVNILFYGKSSDFRILTF